MPIATLLCACGQESDPTALDAAAEEADSGAVSPLDLFELHDRARATCDPELVAELASQLADRDLPVWQDDRALFTGEGAPAGTFNDWTPGDASTPLCGGPLATVVLDVPSGFHEYKMVDASGAWRLDAENRAFAYDDFAGNPDGRNSVLDTWDSGRGHLVAGEPACSDALGGCRAVTAYLPPGYDEPGSDRLYPVLFLHDGQNVFDDAGCCFGNGGWAVNRTLDDEIAAGMVAPVIVVGTDNGGAGRLAEYGGELAAAFMEFQVGTVQPAAAEAWRIDPSRVYTAGSSLGGLIAYRLALAHPDIYAGAASLSGSFFVEDEEGDTVADQVAAQGRLDLALYLDHGGSAEDGGDNYQVNRDLLAALTGAGYARDCGGGPGRVCYFHAEGATHDEAAWRARAWRFLRFLFPP